MQLRHVADYKQPGVSQIQAERAVRLAQEFIELIAREILHASETKEPSSFRTSGHHPL
jgi:hypothetical protein